MSALDDTLTLLRAQGVAKAAFHPGPDHDLAHVEFFAPADAQQHETSTPAVKRDARPVGGLVPRGVSDNP